MMPVRASNQGIDDIVRNAAWTAVEEDGELRLQVELGNDCCVMLVCSLEEPPQAVLWQSRGEHSFNSDTPESFRHWLSEAQAERLASARQAAEKEAQS